MNLEHELQQLKIQLDKFIVSTNGRMDSITRKILRITNAQLADALQSITDVRDTAIIRERQITDLYNKYTEVLSLKNFNAPLELMRLKIRIDHLELIINGNHEEIYRLKTLLIKPTLKDAWDE